MIATQSSPEGQPYASENRRLLGVAMAVFVITVVIGILNGLDLVEFDRNTLLTHVHAGTIGWISLSVLAATLWLFGERPVSGAGSVAALVWLAGVSVPVYVLAFLTGNFAFRAISSIAVLAAIAWWLGWTIIAARSRPLTTPKLALVAGIVTLTYGAVVGVILQVQFATGTTVLGALEGIGAHVIAMAFSYLVLVGMGIIEWRLRPEGPLTAAGVAQVGALFLGGLVLSIGSLLGALAVAGGLNLMGELIGVGIFVGRLARPVLRVPWLQGGALRQGGGSGRRLGPVEDIRRGAPVVELEEEQWAVVERAGQLDELTRDADRRELIVGAIGVARCREQVAQECHARRLGDDRRRAAEQLDRPLSSTRGPPRRGRGRGGPRVARAG